MTDHARKEHAALMQSGIPGLDSVLRGGFLNAGVYIVQGAPGAGKTVFGNQVAYSEIARGGRALYVTLLAETHARMMLHLRSFSFFDEGQVGKAITYISAYKVLEDERLRGLIALIRREISGLKASVVVIDGLVAASQHADSDIEFKKFIHELQAIAGMSGCTFFLLTSSHERVIGAEQTMVDGLILLSDELRGARTERILQITKFRGAPIIRGEHTFRITDDGIVVFPRFEAVLARPNPDDEVSGQRLSSGVVDVDKMIEGGLPNASTTLLVGPSGTGKTCFGLHFLAHASAREPGLMFGFFETPKRLANKARKLGLDIDPLIRRGHVEFVWQAATENLLDELGHRLLQAVEKRQAKRVVIDGLHSFQTASWRPERISHFFSALTNAFRVRGVTTLYTLEAPDILGPHIEMPIKNVSSIAENVLMLRFIEYEGRLRRLLSVIKMRDSNFDPRLREFEITGSGIKLSRSFETAEAVMSGSPHHRVAGARTRKKRARR